MHDFHYTYLLHAQNAFASGKGRKIRHRDSTKLLWITKMNKMRARVTRGIYGDGFGSVSGKWREDRERWQECEIRRGEREEGRDTRKSVRCIRKGYYIVFTGFIIIHTWNKFAWQVQRLQQPPLTCVLSRNRKTRRWNRSWRNTMNLDLLLHSYHSSFRTLPHAAARAPLQWGCPPPDYRLSLWSSRGIPNRTRTRTRTPSHWSALFTQVRKCICLQTGQSKR